MRASTVVAVLLAAYACSLVQRAEAQVTAVHIEHLRSEILPGFVVNRVSIDFADEWSSSQAYTDLIAGSMFQETSLGGDTAPSEVLFEQLPEIEWDSFVTSGGWSAETSRGTPLIISSAANIRQAPPVLQLDATGINLRWGVLHLFLDRGIRYPVAQLTLSNDAQGTLYLFNSAGGQHTLEQFPITHGLIGVPEPSALVLFGVCLASMLALQPKWSTDPSIGQPAGTLAASQFCGKSGNYL